MGLFTNANITFIRQACERIFQHKVTTEFTQGPYATNFKYRPKLRDALITLSMRAPLNAPKSSPIITINCVYRTDPSRVLIPDQNISNPIEALTAAEEIWRQICKADEAALGNLDSFDHFEYLDNLFDWIYAIRKVELKRGQLVDLKTLENTLHNFQIELKTHLDLEELKKDYCKLVAEKTILDRYTIMRDKGAKYIDDRLYLEARLLVESDFDGIPQYKARRF